MSSIKIRLIAGIVVLIMPFLGFPYLWKTIFFIIAGIVLIADALRAYSEAKTHL